MQKTAAGKGIEYPGDANTDNPVADSLRSTSKLYLFLNGGEYAGQKWPKVDMSLWDQATMCATCHVGGTTYEEDRYGKRLPLKMWEDAGAGIVNPFTTTVWEKYDANGTDISYATTAPWAYPMYMNNNQADGPMLVPNGWVQAKRAVKNPNTFANMTTYPGQLMMPNVKEMDCFFCHLKGYDNVMASVMTQAGSLNTAPTMGAGFFDMLPLSDSYMGYNGADASRGGSVNFQTVGHPEIYGPYATMEFVFLKDETLARIMAKPDSNNCMQCHATKTLKDMPEMFGTTGTSSGFLSSAPMIYDPYNPQQFGPLGKRMTAYDINAMWLPRLDQNGEPTGLKSPVIDGSNMMSYMMPGMPYTQASSPTPFNALGAGDLGGGNPAETGPLYYYNNSAQPTQAEMKVSVPVFARAEWFKRGDAWQDGQDVHTFGCGGCHYTGDTNHKNQCDPGRGMDMASGIEDGVPHLVKRGLVSERGAGGFSVYSGMGDPLKHDTRNTVKRCEFCHVTGKSFYGDLIDTYGAPNPDRKHAEYGLTNNIVQISDKVELEGRGGFGGQGVSVVTNFTTPTTKLGRGNHLDVMDCTVCHTQKISMAVRALDATSGMRYPSVVGTNNNAGMIGLFEDPAPQASNDYAVGVYNQMFTAINTFFNYSTTGNLPNTPMAGAPGYQQIIPAGTHVLGSKLQEWKPLVMWQKLGNMEAPLSFGNGAKSQMKYRRKLHLTNPIVAMLWNNTKAGIDANGDTADGGILTNAKPSLTGYTEVFDGELLDENNVQGYGEPIYDPWVMHDLKAGMNFGPSALSVISIGFGPLDGSGPYPQYASAYDADGFFTGGWKYVSVWSGAVVFTEPDEIHSYLQHRINMPASAGNNTGTSWEGTELAIAGAPFMVTHGVKLVKDYVKGNGGGTADLNARKTIGCADCHAPGKEFFTGGFTMTGTAIPASVSFNPTRTIQANAVQNNVTGDYDRNPANPAFSNFLQQTNLMWRPLEPYRVKAYKGEMRTFFEGMNKLGQPRTAKFEATDGTYVWTTPLERADVLYPEEDGAIYYKITDVDANGTPLAGVGHDPIDGRDYAAYLENTTAIVDVAGNTTVLPTVVAPSAIATINSVAATGGTSVISVNAAIPITLGADTSAAGMTYDWRINTSTFDGTIPAADQLPLTALTANAVISNRTAADPTITFNKSGLWRVTLTVKNSKGEISVKTQRVNVTVPNLITQGTVSSISVTGLTTLAGVTTTRTVITTKVPVSLGAAGGTYTKVKYVWNDGSASTIVTTNNITDQTHVYNLLDKFRNFTYNATTGAYTYTGTVYNYTTTVQFWDNLRLIATKSIPVSINTVNSYPDHF